MRSETQATRFAIVIFAAGASSRMQGRDKHLELVDGQPLLTHLFQEACKAAQSLEQKRGGCADVYAVVPAHEKTRLDAAQNAKIIEVRSENRGMGTSIATAMKALNADYDAVIFVLGDMPEITQAHISALMERFDENKGTELLRAATPVGLAGHPVGFGKRYFEELSKLTGDQGARAIIERYSSSLQLVQMQDQAPILDLDTPEDWARWREYSAKTTRKN